MTLTEFLLARIAEDEAAATLIHDRSVCDLVINGVPDPTWGWECTCGVPARVLARCKADRQLLELHADNGTIPGKYELRCYACDSDYPCDTLKIMASPYSDHQDFHPGWR